MKKFKRSSKITVIKNKIHPAQQNVPNDNHVPVVQGENDVESPSQQIQYILEPLTPDPTPASADKRPSKKSLAKTLEDLKIQTRLVFWLIGSVKNKQLDRPFGRRFIKDFLQIVLDSGGLLVCQGTETFFDCIRTHCDDPKLKSAKKKLKSLVCKNKKNEDEENKYEYDPKLEKFSLDEILEEDIFQFVLLFEGGDVTQDNVKPNISENAIMIRVKDKDPLENGKEQENGHGVLYLETMYEEEAFSIENFIYEEYLAYQWHNIAEEETKTFQDLFLLCIYLNQTANLPYINFNNCEGEDLKWLERAACSAVSLYRQDFLTVMCQRGMNLMQIMNEKRVIEHLKTVEWCSKICKDQESLTITDVREELKRRIEHIIGKNYFKSDRSYSIYNSNGTAETVTEEIAFDLAKVLFLDAVLENKLEASLLYWTLLRRPLTAALMAIGLFKAMKKTDNTNTVTENMNIYKKLSIEAVNSSYVKNISETFTMVMNTVEEWGGVSCVHIAIVTENKEFLSERPLVELQERLWRGQPLAGQSYDSKSPEKETHTRHLESWRAPAKVYVYTCISYLVFLVMYGLLLLFNLETSTFHILEFLIPAWVGTLALQVIEKMLPLNRHVFDLFFFFDLFAVILYCIAVSLCVAAFFYPSYPIIMDVARVCYSLDYMAFTLRLLHFCYDSGFLGPVTAMIFEMFKTLFKFLVIIGIFLLGAVVATESVMYPGAPLQITELYFIFRKAYWSMFGEYFLNEIESRGDACTNNPQLYNDHSEIRCATEVGRYYGPVIMAAFVLVVNLLIFSSIVASFNSKITNFEEIWHHQKFKLTMEYYRMIFLQPPLLFLCILLAFFRYHEENKKRKDRQVKFLESFERDVAMHLKQQIDDGRFFNRLKDYKRVVERTNMNTSLGTFQSDISELKNLAEFKKNVQDDLKKLPGFHEQLKSIKEELININLKLSGQPHVPAVPPVNHQLLTP